MWLAISVDMWRLILLTTAVVVTVISFAAAVKPLADGKLSPADALRFMLYALPPMLQYALPFAACFGAALTYHRWASDNEITAAQAAGVPFRMIFAPAAITGTLLTVFMFFFANQVIPEFLLKMERMITRDAVRFFVSEVSSGRALHQKDDGVYIYADRAEQRQGADGSSELVMSGLLVVQVDPETGAVRSEGSFPEAFATVTPEQIVLRGKNGFVKMEGLQGTPQSDQQIPIDLPSLFEDDPKFRTWGGLSDLKRNPDQMRQIRDRKQRLASAVAQREMLEDIQRQLREHGRASLTDANGNPALLVARNIRFQHAKLEGQIIPHKDKPVVLQTTRSTGMEQTQFAESAQVWAIDPIEADPEPSLGITLMEVSTQTAGDEIRGQPGPPLARWKHSHLRPANNPYTRLMEMRSEQVIAAAEQRLAEHKGEDALRPPLNDLRERRAKLMREITSKQQERLASAATCLVMVLTGGIMAVRLRHKLPLHTYLWAFFPALGSVIAISAGQQMVHDIGIGGLPVLWGGVVGLGVFAALELRALAKN